MLRDSAKVVVQALKLGGLQEDGLFQRPVMSINGY
jgi:hypothetical protein